MTTATRRIRGLTDEREAWPCRPAQFDARRHGRRYPEARLMTDTERVVLLYDVELMRPACVLLQAVAGGDRNVLNQLVAGLEPRERR